MSFFPTASGFARHVTFLLCHGKAVGDNVCSRGWVASYFMKGSFDAKIEWHGLCRYLYGRVFALVECLRQLSEHNRGWKYPHCQGFCHSCSGDGYWRVVLLRVLRRIIS